MIARGDIVLLDTNVIIEAHRVNCWKSMMRVFRLETVEECCVELATGDRRRPGYQVVDVEVLRTQMTVHFQPKLGDTACWIIDCTVGTFLLHKTLRACSDLMKRSTNE
jgi:hypothetical protein